MLSAEECRRLVSEVQGEFMPSHTGGIGGDDIRRASVARLPPEEFDWVYYCSRASRNCACLRVWAQEMFSIRIATIRVQRMPESRAQVYSRVHAGIVLANSATWCE